MKNVYNISIWLCHCINSFVKKNLCCKMLYKSAHHWELAIQGITKQNKKFIPALSARLKREKNWKPSPNCIIVYLLFFSIRFEIDNLLHIFRTKNIQLRTFCHKIYAIKYQSQNILKNVSNCIQPYRQPFKRTFVFCFVIFSAKITRYF